MGTVTQEYVLKYKVDYMEALRHALVYSQSRGILKTETVIILRKGNKAKNKLLDRAYQHMLNNLMNCSYYECDRAIREVS